jgi:hypothetical protein
LLEQAIAAREQRAQQQQQAKERLEVALSNNNNVNELMQAADLSSVECDDELTMLAKAATETAQELQTQINAVRQRQEEAKAAAERAAEEKLNLQREKEKAKAEGRLYFQLEQADVLSIDKLGGKVEELLNMAQTEGTAAQVTPQFTHFFESRNFDLICVLIFAVGRIVIIPIVSCSALVGAGVRGHVVSRALLHQRLHPQRCTESSGTRAAADRPSRRRWCHCRFSSTFALLFYFHFNFHFKSFIHVRRCFRTRLH